MHEFTYNNIEKSSYHPYGSGASWSDEVFELFSMLKEFKVIIIFIGFSNIMYF